MSWLMNGPLPDWIIEEPDRQFYSIDEAWTELAEYTCEISPRIEEQQLRALRMVFYAGARNALQALSLTHSYDHLESLMAERWPVFARDCVLPYVYPAIRPVFAPEVMNREISEILNHQRGYWLSGMRTAILCRRTGIDSRTLENEIKKAGKEVITRHRAA
jgi:hypothetical protein